MTTLGILIISPAHPKVSHATQSFALLSLVQRLVVCLTPSHYLNECWLIVAWTPKNKLWIKIQRFPGIQDSTFENVFCKGPPFRFGFSLLRGNQPGANQLLVISANYRKISCCQLLESCASATSYNRALAKADFGEWCSVNSDTIFT